MKDGCACSGFDISIPLIGRYLVNSENVSFS